MVSLKGVRPATHAGTWYSGSSNKLGLDVSNWLESAQGEVIDCSRAAIGPHAGYRYCGHILGYTYSALPPGITRVVLMGPSHFKYFKGLQTTQFSAFETPLGAVHVDVDVVNDLLKYEFISGAIKPLDIETDLREHSWEMHLPFIKTISPQAKLIPLLFGDSSELGHLSHESLNKLKQLFMDPSCAFVVSSDFCHWGDNFGYTPYANKAPLIYKYIESLDKQALETLGRGSSTEWHDYIKSTQNTICGRNPIQFLLELGEQTNNVLNFKLLKYNQSSKVKHAKDMSVSYAAAVSTNH